jgi:pre-mRNA-splicing factor CWC26
VGKSLATFQKSKSTWATVGSTSLPLAQAGPSRTSENDQMDEDIKPDMEAVQKEEKKQLTKRKGGLRTAAQIREEAEQLAAERAAAAAAEAENGEGSGSGSGHAQGPGETVHRDSSGRIVDVEKLKREAKEKEEEEKRKAREREEWSKGMVQRQGREDRARQEREMGERDVAR